MTNDVKRVLRLSRSAVTILGTLYGNREAKMWVAEIQRLSGDVEIHSPYYHARKLANFGFVTREDGEDGLGGTMQLSITDLGCKAWELYINTLRPSPNPTDELPEIKPAID